MTSLEAIKEKLHTHCQDGELLIDLLKKYPTLKNSQNSSGNTFLLTCIKLKLTDESQYLIELGVDVNLANNVFYFIT